MKGSDCFFCVVLVLVWVCFVGFVWFENSTGRRSSVPYETAFRLHLLTLAGTPEHGLAIAASCEVFNFFSREI